MSDEYLQHEEKKRASIVPGHWSNECLSKWFRDLLVTDAIWSMCHYDSSRGIRNTWPYMFWTGELFWDTLWSCSSRLGSSQHSSLPILQDLLWQLLCIYVCGGCLTTFTPAHTFHRPNKTLALYKVELWQITPTIKWFRRFYILPSVEKKSVSKMWLPCSHSSFVFIKELFLSSSQSRGSRIN